MKTLILLTTILIITSCGRSKEEANNHALNNSQIYKIDNCEYIGSGSLLTNNAFLTHKGNCSNPIHQIK